MSQPLPLSAFRGHAGHAARAGRLRLAAALLALLLAGAAAWFLPQRPLLPLERALRADRSGPERPEQGP